MTPPRAPRPVFDWLFWLLVVLGTAFGITVIRLLWAFGTWLMR